MRRRDVNDRAFCEAVLERGALTRAEFAAITGLTVPAAQLITARLEGDGLLAPHGREPRGTSGPRAMRYGFPAGLGLVVGVNVTGDTIRTRRVPLGAAPGDEQVVPLAQRGDVAQQVLDAVGDVSGHRWVRVVVGLPGAVDPATGEVIFAWDLPGWHDGVAAAIREGIVGSTGDADAIAFHREVNLRAGAELPLSGSDADFALFSLGIGVGSALVRSGQVVIGAHGAAGEIGFLTADPDGLTALRHGSQLAGRGLQSLLGAKAVARLAGVEYDPGLAWVDRFATLPPDDPVMVELGRRICAGLTAICLVADPERLVLAGELVRRIGPGLVEPVQVLLREVLPWPLDVRVSTAGDAAILDGAVKEAQRSLMAVMTRSMHR